MSERRERRGRGHERGRGRRERVRAHDAGIPLSTEDLRRSTARERVRVETHTESETPQSRFSIRRPFTTAFNIARLRPAVTIASGITLAAFIMEGAQAALTFGAISVPALFFKNPVRRYGLLAGSAALLTFNSAALITFVIGGITVVEIAKHIWREMHKKGPTH